MTKISNNRRFRKFAYENTKDNRRAYNHVARQNEKREAVKIVADASDDFDDFDDEYWDAEFARKEAEQERQAFLMKEAWRESVEY